MTDEEALKRLMGFFYFDHDEKIEWRFIEGTTLESLDDELANYVRKYVPDP